MNALVTVGIALYNHQNYIEKCINSILTQTYKNIEIIIINDGSSDNSFDVVKNIVEKQKYNKNIILKSRENKGMCNTLNEIAHQANGKYISFIGSDDYWKSNKIEDQVKFLEKNSDLALVHSNSIKVNEFDDEIGKLDFSKKKNSGMIYKSIIYGEGGINTPSHLYRTRIFKEIGYYDPTFKFEDTDFWLRLTSRYKIGFINEYHTYYRWHGDNLSTSQNMLKFYYEELLKIYKKNIIEPELRKYAICKILRKSYTRSLRSLKLKYFFHYLIRYLKCKYLNKCN